VLPGLLGLALLWLSRGWWWPAPPPPQLILVLGGDVAREQRAAELAQSRGLPVVVSGGSNPEYAHWLFEQRQGLPRGQVQLDYRARDTLSNFTSLVDDLRRARIRHALLVTSSDHMDRALLWVGSWRAAEALRSRRCRWPAATGACRKGAAKCGETA
jgi:uncharacterized SAM-binding protein YcdF (DUF218 family)